MRICGTFSAEGSIFMLLLLLLGQLLLVLLGNGVKWGARKPSESWDQNVVAGSRRAIGRDLAVVI